MKRFLTIALLTLATLTWTAQASAEPAWARGESRGEDLQVYLLTFGVGDDIASWFGHTAFLVRDQRTRDQRVYNYGMFSFGPDMLPKFLMGRLEFWVDDASVPRTISLYRALNRDIIATELNLTPEKRKEVAEFLAWNILPENRDYLYHHYLDNCATRVRDVIDKATDGQFKDETSDPGRLTFRGHTHRHTQRNPFIDTLLSLWMNDEIDAPIAEWDEMFLPGELLKQVHALKYTNTDGEEVDLVLSEQVLFDADRPGVPHDPATRWPWMLLFGIAFAGVAWWAALEYQTTGASRWRRLLGGQHFLAGILFGVPGLVAVLFHFTDHQITFLNENMLLWSPLTFLALPLSFPIMRGRPWAMRVMRRCWYVMAFTSVLAVLLKVLPAFDQQNQMALAMLVPFNLFMAAAMHRFATPPTRGALVQVADDVWSVSCDRRFLDTKIGSRMTVVRLPDGTLWLHSPIPWDEALAAELEQLGPIAHVVGPNRYHHMHLTEWAQRYPDAKLYAAPGLEKKRSDLDFSAVLGEELPPGWRDVFDAHHFGGAPALSEVAFFHRPSRTLIVCDLAENFGTSDHLPTRLYLKVMGVENEFRLSPIVRAAFRDRAAARASVKRLLEWDFQRILLSHGEPLEEDARARFERSFEFLG